MSSCQLVAAILLVCGLTFSAAQNSCKERCGSGYYRGSTCQCDYSCLLYGECCKDFESLCTSKDSCRGRCGESFKRGRMCTCDSDCVKYNQCCPDYADHCSEEEEVDEEASVAAPVKPISCADNVHGKPKESAPTAATEESVEAPLSVSEGNDPGDSFIPLVDSTSVPQDDLNNDGKQIFHNGEVEGPESTPTPEATSGFGPTPLDPLEDFSAGPALPDLDGFELTAETYTVLPEMQTTASKEETTQADAGLPTAGPGTEEPPISENTDADNQDQPTPTSPQTIAPEPTEVTTMSSDPTSEPPSDTTDLQTGPTQPDQSVTETLETTAPPSEEPEPTPLDPEMTDTPDKAEETTTAAYVSSAAPENTEASTTVPDSTATSAQTTSNPEMDTTDSTNPSTLASVEVASEVSTMATTNGKEDTSDVAPDATPAEALDATPSPTSPPKPTPKPEEKPNPEKPQPSKPVLKPDSKPETNGMNLDDPKEYQGDDSNDTNLCSGRPFSGVTTLNNGTTVVFRGHFFWVLDGNQEPGPARGITELWGVPSPIDTVFTRCNCQGKTYIFNGRQYWRFENDALDPGYPKVVEAGFDGLRGHITAALSVPQYNRRRESVYFFKRGGQVQKYSYQFGTNPTCGKKVQYAVLTTRNRIARQAPPKVSLLGPAINIRTSWRGFPTTITAAVSIPNRREPEGYSYHVFSRSKSYKIRMDSGRPVVAAPKANTSTQSNGVIKCPKKVSQSL